MERLTVRNWSKIFDRVRLNVPSSQDIFANVNGTLFFALTMAFTAMNCGRAMDSAGYHHGEGFSARAAPVPARELWSREWYSVLQANDGTMVENYGRAMERQERSWSKTFDRAAEPHVQTTFPIWSRRRVLYFMANDGTHGYELWRSEGTPSGTTMVKDIRSGVEHPVPKPHQCKWHSVLFANDGRRIRTWKSDGTPNGTVLVRDIHPGWNSSYIANLTNVNGSLFHRHDGSTGTEL